MPAHSHRIALSAADLDRGGDTYISVISKILAAIIVLLWGSSMVLAGFFGIQPGTDVATLAQGSGVALILLAADQLWRAMRNLS
jgi:hypothetical protein